MQGMRATVMEHDSIVLTHRHRSKGKFPHFFRKMAKAHSNSPKILADNKNIFVSRAFCQRLVMANICVALKIISESFLGYFGRFCVQLCLNKHCIGSWHYITKFGKCLKGLHQNSE